MLRSTLLHYTKRTEYDRKVHLRIVQDCFCELAVVPGAGLTGRLIAGLHAHQDTKTLTACLETSNFMAQETLKPYSSRRLQNREAPVKAKLQPRP